MRGKGQPPPPDIGKPYLTLDWGAGKRGKRGVCVRERETLIKREKVGDRRLRGSFPIGLVGTEQNAFRMELYNAPFKKKRPIERAFPY